jgi:hypothetical protein
MPIAIPPALGGLWRTVLSRHSGARGSLQQGIVPILTRLTIAANDVSIRVDHPTETHAGFELARDENEQGEVTRLFMNVWCDVHGAAGRVLPPGPVGPLTLAGQVFAEHTFTRLFAPPEQRRLTRLHVAGYPEVPEARYAAPASATAGELPEGATWLDELSREAPPVPFTLDQTDSNQHVNSLVYIRVFLDAAQRRLAHAGQRLDVRSRAVDIAYRKPCFAGERVHTHVRLFALARPELPDLLGAAGFISGDDDRPRCYVRAIFGR